MTQKEDVFLQPFKNLFDTHAHYNNEQFSGDYSALLSTFDAHGICGVINVGYDLPSSLMSVQLALQFQKVYAAVGVHPHDAKDFSDETKQQLQRLASQNKVVAIGEIGLDYHYDFSPRETQKSVFEQQLLLAQSLNLPVIVHMREATKDTLTLLQKYRPRGVVHCFSSSAQTATMVLELGMYLGFTGIVTFPNAKKVHEALAITPIERILLETDCPYMAPVPYRGKRCDSTMMWHTAETVAKIKQIDTQKLIDQATQNAKKCFAI